MKLLPLLITFVSFALASVDINHASLNEMQQLKGVGEKKAQAIIDYRTHNGCFLKPEALVNVKGIGEKILEKNRDSIEAKPCK